MRFSEADAGKINERVVAVVAEACNGRELDQPALRPSAGKHGDDLDRLGDERALRPRARRIARSRFESGVD
jgi:hypothetical protein